MRCGHNIRYSGTLDAAAEALECSRQKVWRIECGIGAARGVDVRAMCDLYGTAPELVNALVGLASETKAKGWWHAYGDAIPDWFELYVGLESAASHLRGFDEALIPGLLQNRAYALSVYQNRADMTEEELDRLIEVRIQRQGLLRRRPSKAPRIDSVLYKAVLHRRVGGPEIMAEQLAYLLELTKLPNISIRVLRMATGPQYGALAGTFMMLDFPPGNRATPEPSVVYSESLTGALYLDRPDELAAYEKVWASLDSLALDEEQSRYLIYKIIGEVRNG